MAAKILLHVGYAKSASTSLQRALSIAPEVLYPKAGRLSDHEHLSLPLKLKGIDAWTAQFVDDEWVERQHAEMMLEISRAHGAIAISSERLMDMTIDQMNSCRSMFEGYDVEIVAIIRPKREWLSSTWRHAVFWHDFTTSWEEFEQSNHEFSMDTAPELFSSVFPTHRVSLDQPDWVARLESIYGARLDMNKDNEGISFAAAEALQRLHLSVGTERFREFFDEGRKRDFARMFTDGADALLEPLNAKLF